MFHTDVTTEDVRIIATAGSGRLYNVTFYDLFKGESYRLELWDRELISVLAVVMACDELKPTSTLYINANKVQQRVTNVRFMP